MADWALATPQYVRLDLFPALVTPRGASAPVTDRGRVILTDEHMYVLEDATGGPRCIISGVLYDADGTNRKGYTVELDDGTSYDVKRSTNCGCGSLLRGLHPFPGVPYSRFKT